MAFFKPQSDAEKFVRSHCLFVSTYFSGTDKSVFCNNSEKSFSDVIASGTSETEEAAWEITKESVKQRLAKLEMFSALLAEVYNSSLPSKELLGIMLQKKCKKLGKGIKPNWSAANESQD